MPRFMFGGSGLNISYFRNDLSLGRVDLSLTNESLHESFIDSRVLVKGEQELHER